MTNIEKLLFDLCGNVTHQTIDNGISKIHEIVNSQLKEVALIEINNLRNPDDVEVLKKIILSKTTIGKKKQFAIKMLGKLTANIESEDSLDFFFNLLDTIKDNNELIHILNAIAENSYKKQDYSLLIKLALNRNSQVAHHALKALISFENFNDENFVISIFSNNKNESIKIISCALLSCIATEQSLEILIESFNKTRDHGLRISIYQCLQILSLRIKGNKLLNTFLSKSYRKIKPKLKEIYFENLELEIDDFINKENLNYCEFEFSIDISFKGFINIQKDNCNQVFIDFGLKNIALDSYANYLNTRPYINFREISDYENFDDVYKTKAVFYFKSGKPKLFIEFYNEPKLEIIEDKYKSFYEQGIIPQNFKKSDLNIGLLKTSLVNNKNFIDYTLKQIYEDKTYYEAERYVRKKKNNS